MPVTPETIAPGDPGWDAARTGWNLAVDQRPALVALPRTADEAAAAVRMAAERGLRVAVQNTGHAAGRIPMDDGTLLVRTGGLDEVAIDPAAGTARIGGGAAWGAVVPRAQEHGLAAATGSAATVGVVGFLTGGGHGWLAGRTGLSANDLRAVELVTGDGEVVRLDDASDPEAMWALRGGGALGVIAAVEVGLHELEGLAGGGLMWPVDQTAEVLEAWRAWSTDLPEGVTTIGRVLRFPPIEPVPEPFRGRSFVVVEAVDLDGIERLGDLVAPLRALGPEIDTLRPMVPTELPQVHMDPPDPVPAIGGGMLLERLTGDAVAAAVLATTDGPGQALLGMEIRRLGGPVARARAAGIVTALPDEGSVYAVGIAASPELAAASAAGVAAVRGALEPFGSPRGLPNIAAESDPTASIFPADDCARLDAVARRLDPEGRILRRP